MANPSDHAATDRLRFYGRRKGQKLSRRQQDLLDRSLDRYALDLEGAAHGALDPLSLFAGGIDDVWLEIGFGKGEHLARQAAAHPHVGIIGCEPYLNGVARLLVDVTEQDLSNVRIHADDARTVLDVLRRASVSRVFLLHPDPWPKARHARRRFVNAENIALLARIMADGAELRIGTDHPGYCAWTLQQMQRQKDFVWTAGKADDWRRPPDDWPETRYARKAMDGTPVYLTFQRRSRS